ncbi:MAG TPA: fibronectin-binding domain-containing protein, partial [Desulfotomaculum sp.]|nr:fibronectin-binding domain-containing protein [Desulfotomaculum sp.]
QQIARPAARGEFHPTLILDRHGRPREFAAFELTHLQSPGRKHGSMNQVADLFYAAREEQSRMEQVRQSLLSAVRREMTRVGRKLALQEESLAEAQRAEELKLYGELLTANLWRLEKGAREVSLENFYDPANRPVTIPLDPCLSPVENAQAYFKKYTRARNTAVEARTRAEQSKEELEYLTGVETALHQAATMTEVAEIRQELEEQGYLPALPAERPGKREPEKPRPLTFTSSDGFTILVGRNNRQNDYLTTRLARDEDIWLHTRQIPGSHVIIRAGGREVPDTTLQEAASLAAYFSRARESQNVPVDYTLRKNVSKPRGARPGYVIYTGQRTINASPGEELVEKLRSAHGHPEK